MTWAKYGCTGQLSPPQYNHSAQRDPGGTQESSYYRGEYREAYSLIPHDALQWSYIT